MNVVSYYNKFKALWDKLYGSEDLTCGCTCAAAIKLRARVERDKTHDFVLGLDDVKYGPLRTQILSGRGRGWSRGGRGRGGALGGHNQNSSAAANAAQAPCYHTTNAHPAASSHALGVRVFVNEGAPSPSLFVTPVQFSEPDSSMAPVDELLAQHLGQKYGPIFKFYLGNKLCVVISSPSLIKEVVRDQDAVFAHRDTTVAAIVATYGGYDIAWSQPNSHWRLMRKIFVQEMLSNTSLEASYSFRKDEVRKTIRHVYANYMGKPIDISELCFRTEVNIMMNISWGGTIEDGERIGAEFRVLLSKLIELFGKSNISDFYPLVAGLDIQGVKKQMENLMQSVDTILDLVIAKHKHKLTGGIKQLEQGKKDILQILFELKEIEDHISISERHIKAMLMDIIAGGTDTAPVVEWAMAELMNNPDAMAKAQKELSDVVGLKNIVEEFHMPNLNYLEAIIKETLRLHPSVPHLLPRTPSHSCTLGGYTIPKNTRVFLNVWSIQRDPSIWDNPTEFNPERFLIDDKKLDFRGNHFHYLPFGSGRRICAGMPLAVRTVTYLLASLVHSFNWKLVEGETLDTSETFGLVLRKTTPLFGIPNPRLPDSNLYM
ncbi:hypothetical protein DH2020_020207 [Rehmannia glutinosa]|uniref:Flavonoid 3'-monooxygenase n=1 Tax=Rehmannia glutinosa TaxID=99300 RepID=A0ABR0WFN4_REHGL